MQAPRLRLLMVGVLLLLAGCAGIPANALKLGSDSIANREMQTRAFQSMRESELLVACAGVLQDIGFTIDESETKLGVITASRKLTSRRPLNSEEVMSNLAGAAVLPYLLGPVAAYRAVAGIKEPQIVRVSLVTGVAGTGANPAASIRVTAQRAVYTNERFAEVKSAEPLNDPKFYAEFFVRIEKSAFLEKQKNAL